MCASWTSIRAAGRPISASDPRPPPRLPASSSKTWSCRCRARHNALNATAAIAVAHELGVSPDAIRKALAGFGGVKRRFTRTGEWNGVTVFDDYGHHPVEIAAVLKAARASTDGQVIAVVQPHRYSRLLIAVRSVLHLLQRCRCGHRRAGLCGGRAADPGRRPRRPRRRPQGARPPQRDGARKVGGSRRPRQGHREAGRLRDLPRRRQHHAMGLCAAGRARRLWARRRHDVSRTSPPTCGPRMPDLRGTLEANAPTAPLSWFRTGGPAQVLFTPADADDLAYFLQRLDRGDAGPRRRAWLQPARPRRRLRGRRHSPRQGLRRDRRSSRAIACAPAPARPT